MKSSKITKYFHEDEDRSHQHQDKTLDTTNE